jgi:hypothetical protein
MTSTIVTVIARLKIIRDLLQKAAEFNVIRILQDNYM